MLVGVERGSAEHHGGRRVGRGVLRADAEDRHLRLADRTCGHSRRARRPTCRASGCSRTSAAAARATEPSSAHPSGPEEALRPPRTRTPPSGHARPVRRRCKRPPRRASGGRWLRALPRSFVEARKSVASAIELARWGSAGLALALWWRGWDSNPRYGETVNQISSLAHSTTLPPLRSGASAGRCRGRDSRACVAPLGHAVCQRHRREARIAEARLPALARGERRGVGDRSGRDDVAGDDRPALRAAPPSRRPRAAARCSGPSRTMSARPVLDVAAVARRASTRNAASSLAASPDRAEAVDRHARADEEAPVQREVGDGVGGGEAPVGEVRVDDLEAVRDPVDAAGELGEAHARRAARARSRT